MASSYTLIASAPTIQVLTPTTSQDIEVAVIQTTPTGVIASYPVDKITFDAGDSGPLLTDFADAIETVISQGKAIGGTGTSDLDVNGLTEYYVTFTVAYNAAGTPPNQVTTEVDVPIAMLSSQSSFRGGSLLGEAEALVNAAYDNLVKMASG